MDKRHLKSFAIIGTGMVGTAIGFLLKKAGYDIVSIIDKSSVALKRALPYTGGKTFSNPQKAVLNADCILITTSDDVISSAAAEIARLSLKGKFVFHMSGAGGLDLLDAAKRAGASIASIHPLQSFSSIDQAIENIPGSYFGVTADKRALALAKKIVSDLGGIPIVVSPSQKPLYHAAACFASNYLVSLIHVVESIYKSIGINEKDARKAYLPLIYGSLKNIEKSGSVLALTGPIARGDCGTVKKHVTAIRKSLPQYSTVYRALGLITTEVARLKGTLKAGDSKKMKSVLKGDIK